MAVSIQKAGQNFEADLTVTQSVIFRHKFVRRSFSEYPKVSQLVSQRISLTAIVDQKV